jgi:hypothetical protein
MKIRSPVCSKQSTRRLPTPRVAKSKRLPQLQDNVQNLFFKSFSNQSMTTAVCWSVGDCVLSEGCLESSPNTRCIASCSAAIACVSARGIASPAFTRGKVEEPNVEGTTTQSSQAPDSMPRLSNECCASKRRPLADM